MNLIDVVTVWCQEEEHRLGFSAKGQLVLPHHPNRAGEEVVEAMGGEPVICLCAVRVYRDQLRRAGTRVDLPTPLLPWHDRVLRAREVFRVRQKAWEDRVSVRRDRLKDHQWVRLSARLIPLVTRALTNAWGEGAVLVRVTATPHQPPGVVYTQEDGFDGYYINVQPSWHWLHRHYVTSIGEFYLYDVADHHTKTPHVWAARRTRRGFTTFCARLDVRNRELLPAGPAPVEVKNSWPPVSGAGLWGLGPRGNDH